MNHLLWKISVFLDIACLFSFVVAGFWEPDSGALVGERVCLPADQPEAVCATCGADRLGRTAGLLALRPLPDRQWETKLQVTHSSHHVCVCERDPGSNVFFSPGDTQTAFHRLELFFFLPRIEQPFELQSHVKVIQSWGSSMNKWMQMIKGIITNLGITAFQHKYISNTLRQWVWHIVSYTALNRWSNGAQEWICGHFPTSLQRR